MAIDRVKAGVTSAAEMAKQGYAELQALQEQIDDAIARVESAATGTSRREPRQVIATWRKAKHELSRAAAVIMSGVEQADKYVARL